MVSLLNAGVRNQDRQFRSGMMANVARTKLDHDAAWNSNIYGNLNNLFKGISDIGRENAQWNMVSDMAGDGIFGNLGKSYTGRRYTDEVPTHSKGGKLKKRKRGLTF